MEIGDPPIYLPVEILSLIARFLQTSNLERQNREQDIQSLRLTCKAFEVSASPYLLRRLWISTRHEDHQKMRAVANHPVFSQHIDIIAYDFTCYESYFALNEKTYVSTLGEQNDPPKSTWYYWRRISNAKVSLPIEVRRAGWEKYRNQYLIQCTAELPSSADRVDDDSELPSDLKCLIECLPKLRKVKHFRILDSRWNSDQYYWTKMPGELVDVTETYHLSFLISEGKEEWDPLARPRRHSTKPKKAAVINPRPYYRLSYREGSDISEERQMNRCFFVLTSAISKLKLETVESFECTELTDGLSSTLFSGIIEYSSEWLTPTLTESNRMNEYEFNHASNAFKFLKNIELTFSVDTLDPYDRWLLTLQQGTIGKIMQCAQSAEKISLGIINTEVSIPKISNIVGDVIFSHLKSISISKMHITHADTVEFLSRHKNTLQVVDWECLVLHSDDTLDDWSEEEYTFDECRDVIKEIGTIGLKLKSLSLSAGSGSGELFIEHDDPAQIAYFLHAGYPPPQPYGVGPVKGAGIRDVSDEFLQAYFDQVDFGMSVDDIRRAAGVTHFTHRWEADSLGFVLRESLKDVADDIDYSKASFHYGTSDLHHGSYEEWCQSRKPFG